MERENRNLKVLVVILCILVLGLGGYFVYDKVFSEDLIEGNSTTNNGSNGSEGNELEKDNIDLEEIKDVFGFVYYYYDSPIVYCGKIESTNVEIYGTSRYASTEFSTYDEMLGLLKKYMSVEVIAGKSPWAATTKEYYLEKDGRLYCTETYKGIMHDYGDINIEINSKDENKIDCVATMEIIDPDNNKSYDKINLVLEKYDNNWIITSYEKQNTELR